LSLLYQISDNWRRKIKLDKTFQHQTVKYNLNFVDPNTVAHTNYIESLWNSGKIQFKSMRGVSRKFLNSYLTFDEEIILMTTLEPVKLLLIQ
jgi:hypothetical protein